MDFDTYQSAAWGTAIYPDATEEIAQELNHRELSGLLQLNYAALGLAGEAGEFAGHIKKIMRDGAGTVSASRRIILLDELGDVLWYVNACAGHLSMPLNEVARRNVEKLLDRKERNVLKGDGDTR